MTAVAATAARRTPGSGVRRERHEAALPAAVAVHRAGRHRRGDGLFGVQRALATSRPARPGSQGLQQGIWAALGLAAMLAASRIDFRVLRYVAIPLRR